MPNLEPQFDIDAGQENIFEILDLGIALEAMDDKIIVLMDTFRSGFECQTCKKTGKVHVVKHCVCDTPEMLAGGVQPGTRNRFGAICEECQGDYQSKRVDKYETCPACQGRGELLVIPDSAKSLPTTGLVVSIGPNVTKIKRKQRIIATPHSGIYIPTKTNVPIKIYREHEPLAYVYNIAADGVNTGEQGELETNQFVEYDTPLKDNANA